MLRVGVLASGNGSNFQALHEACACGYADARIECVLTDKADADVMQRAGAAGVEAVYVDPRSACAREEYDKQLGWHLDQHGVDLVCGAGFMRVLSASFVRERNVLNVHPSLLPAFPGLRAIDRAFDAGVKVTGVTVHLMDDGLDTGPIVAQRAVDVPPALAELTLRIHAVEHELYPWVLQAWAAGRVHIDGRRVSIT